MNGQLWQECPTCGAAPVCSDCMYCGRHCSCVSATYREQSSRREAERASARAQTLSDARERAGLIDIGYVSGVDLPILE
jgi:hypothetical protein